MLIICSNKSSSKSVMDYFNPKKDKKEEEIEESDEEEKRNICQSQIYMTNICLKLMKIMLLTKEEYM